MAKRHELAQAAALRPALVIEEMVERTLSDPALQRAMAAQVAPLLPP